MAEDAVLGVDGDVRGVGVVVRRRLRGEGVEPAAGLGVVHLDAEPLRGLVQAGDGVIRGGGGHALSLARGGGAPEWHLWAVTRPA